MAGRTWNHGEEILRAIRLEKNDDDSLHGSSGSTGFLLFLVLVLLIQKAKLVRTRV